MSEEADLLARVMLVLWDYRDSEDNQIYQYRRDSDTEPGSGIALVYLPHELANICFCFVRVS